MSVITAQQILDENNYTPDDIPLIKLEYLIDNVINHVNLKTGRSISNLSGDTPGSKTVTVLNEEAPVIKLLSALMIRAYKDRGTNVAGSGVTVNTVISDPQYSLFMKLVDEDINRLCGMSFKRV